MRVRVEHGVDLADMLSNRLLPKVRSGVDQHELPAVFQQH